MRTVCIVAVVSFVVTLASCASVPLANSEWDAAAKRFLPSQERAVLYVARPKIYPGAALTLNPIVDKQLVGSLNIGHYVVTELVPGRHKIALGGTGFGVSEPVEFEARAGQLYFFRVYPKMGMPGLGIKQLTEKEGKKLVRKSKLVTGF